MDTLKILVVDDEAGMRAGVVRALRDFHVRLPDINGDVGFAIDQAETGEQAVEMVRRQPPDILLLDHKLPGMSGLDVLEAINALQGETLVVMITAYATLETAVTATKRGAYDFLAKPFTPEELKSTIRKAAGRQILAKQARKLAHEKRQVRFQFISVLAHELKAPLGAIEGYLNIIKSRAAGDDPAVYERLIQRSLVRAEHMRKMITDLLDMTHIESGQRTRELADLDLVEVARAAMEIAAPAAALRKISIQLDADGPVSFKADRGEIEMILNNLLSNAVKYNRDGGQVKVAVTPNADGVTLAVSDTGIGMTVEESSRLFADFYRAKNPQTRDILGSGLGLSIVRRLAQLYDGAASAASQPDVGSTFTVVLKS